MNPPSPLSIPVPATAASPALVAFLRGVGRRVIVFAHLQCGDPGRAGDALAAMLPAFIAEAGERPMAQWPARFWGLLLASPVLRDVQGMAPRRPPEFAALDGLGAGPRTALLLWLVAGLDEEDAAAALGVDAATLRLALQRAAPQDVHGAVDLDAWQRWATASREAQQAVPAASLASWERECRVALAQPQSQPVPANLRAGSPRWLLPALWTAFGACVVALAMTFAWPLPRPGADAAASDDAGGVRVRRAPLPAAAAPLATFDAASGLRNHPDLEQLAAADDVLLRDLDLYAWRAAESGVEPGEESVAAMPLPAPRGSLQQRIAEWDALPAGERGARRERWHEWQALPAVQRAQVQDAAAAFATLAPDAQQALRLEFAQLAPDERRGWLLGPRLGRAWPKLEPLLMQVPATQREPLLAILHALSPLELDDLATLAQRTPPQGRDELRRELLSTSAANRAAWLHERLQR